MSSRTDGPNHMKGATMLPYQDPAHDGNSAKYYTGKSCIVKGCRSPAGTWWGPHWCFEHNVERMDRISASLDAAVERAKFSAMVDEATAGWHGAIESLLKERNAILRAAGGKITATKEQHEREASHWSHQSHKDGSQTYQID